MNEPNEPPLNTADELFNETLVDLAPWLAKLREDLARGGPGVHNYAKGMKVVAAKTVDFFTQILHLQQEGVHTQLGYRSASDIATRNDFSFWFSKPQLNSEQPTDAITITSCTCGQVWPVNLMHLSLAEFQALPEHLSFDRVLGATQ